jgi:hypothetical protein
VTSAPPSTDPLRDAEDRLDADTLATLLIATPEAGRRARATELQGRIDAVLRATEWSQQTAAHHHTAQIAWFGTGSARELRWSSYRFGGFGPHPRLADLLAARPRNVMPGIVRSLLVHDAHVYWPVVRRLVEDGRFPHPEAAEYLVGMVQNLGAMSWGRSHEITLAGALLERFADPRIVEELWEAFELEVVVDQIAVTGWQEGLVAAVQRGLIDRDRMLDVAVQGQLRDLRRRRRRSSVASRRGSTRPTTSSPNARSGSSGSSPARIPPNSERPLRRCAACGHEVVRSTGWRSRPPSPHR